MPSAEVTWSFCLRREPLLFQTRLCSVSRKVHIVQQRRVTVEATPRGNGLTLLWNYDEARPYAHRARAQRLLLAAAATHKLIAPGVGHHSTCCRSSCCYTAASACEASVSVARAAKPTLGAGMFIERQTGTSCQVRPCTPACVRCGQGTESNRDKPILTWLLMAVRSLA